MNNFIHITECPRDAMQSWKTIIETQKKIDYINQLYKCGFNTIDAGSFVSAKAIPQMADSDIVFEQIKNENKVNTISIIANTKGALRAIKFKNKISHLGFPFSISPSFQFKNSNSTIEDSFDSLKEIITICKSNNFKLIIYISMAFGNPYGDDYDVKDISKWIKKINKEWPDQIFFSLADTVGLATPKEIFEVYTTVKNEFQDLAIGLHLHAEDNTKAEKIDAALIAGCRYFDSAILGKGGCPMAGNDLVGNIDTIWLLDYLESKNYETNINIPEFKKAISIASTIFV